MLELDAPAGHVLLQARTPEVRRFLQRTFAEVPRGQETELLDTDALIRALLNESC